MMDSDTSKPAFPNPHFKGFMGMSLRDWFAGQALSGLVGGKGVVGATDAKSLAKSAYSLADAMLEARGGQ